MYVCIYRVHTTKSSLERTPTYRLNFRADPKHIRHFADDVTKVDRIKRVTQPNLRYLLLIACL